MKNLKLNVLKECQGLFKSKNISRITKNLPEQTKIVSVPVSIFVLEGSHGGNCVGAERN